MRDFGRSDWQLASMVCQTLWNYSGKITSSNATYGEEESQELQDVLVDYLGNLAHIVFTMESYMASMLTWKVAGMEDQ